VEDAIFKVPKNHFSASSVFATIFSEQDVEGMEDKPFVLHGVKEVDFENLLKFMYPPSLMPTNGKLTREEWISVLKLCMMWEFTEFRNRAIEKLFKDPGIGIIDKIELGKNYGMDHWILEGYVALLKQNSTITCEEAEHLGWQMTAKLLLLREQCIVSELNRCYDCRQLSRPISAYDFTTAVRKQLQEASL